MIGRWFTLTSGIALAVTGFAKVVAMFGSARLLDYQDPITALPFRYLLLVMGVLELIIAYLCFFTNNLKLSAILMAWFSTSLVIYRAGLWFMGWQHPCPCLGNLTDALHIPPQTADTAMKIILAYLLIGSYATLFWLWRQRKKVASSAVGAASV